MKVNAVIIGYQLGCCRKQTTQYNDNLRLRDAEDNALRGEKYVVRKKRGCVNRIFALRLLTEKGLCHQNPLVLVFIDFSLIQLIEEPQKTFYLCTIYQINRLKGLMLSTKIKLLQFRK